MGWQMTGNSDGLKKKEPKPFQKHLSEGAKRFLEKYGFKPNLGLVHPAVFETEMQRLRNEPLMVQVPLKEGEGQEEYFVMDGIKIKPDRDTQAALLYLQHVPEEPDVRD
jgi:hypothetical protein